jgi:hypothetical protein
MILTIRFFLASLVMVLRADQLPESAIASLLFGLVVCMSQRRYYCFVQQP